MKMSETTISRRTAISRRVASLPIRLIVDSENLQGHGLHFGCGKDHTGTAALHKIPGVVTFMEYDPNYADYPEMLDTKYDFVISNYVLNILPPRIRKKAIEDITACVKTKGVVYITVRAKGQSAIIGTPLYDGYRTSIGTFQKEYTVVGLKRELSRYFKNIQVIHGGTSRKFIMIKASNG